MRRTGHTFTTRTHAWIALLGAAALVTGCAVNPEPTPSPPEQAQRALGEVPTLNTFISDYLEIDQLGPNPPQDANLFTGLDPADGTPSALKPGPGTGAYIDWQDLGTDLDNHRILDLNAPSGKDPSSFPRSNECVGSSKVLSKMDLVYAASANNQEYAYFAVLRSGNNGDAGYYWLFTRKKPSLTPEAGPCHPGESQLTYDISGPANGAGGDILLSGHFKPNGAPFLEIYRAAHDANGVTAVDAINYLSGLWVKEQSAVATVAVNTTPTAPGAFGSEGVKAVDGNGNLEADIFAEAAVPISVFTGSTPCGATFYGSVITRSSGSGGINPDLKDLIGPALFNFGSVDASASLTPTCGLAVGYHASAKGPDGQALTNPSCHWVFDTGEEAFDCSSDSFNLPAGARSATVTVSDPQSSCSDTVTTAAVNVYPKLGVTANLTATCQQSFDYTAQATGGSDPSQASYYWTFKYDNGGSLLGTSASQTGNQGVPTPGIAYTGYVTAKDVRADITCEATAFDTAMPYAPIQVSLDLAQNPGQCPGLLSDQVVYQATASGGDGNYQYLWKGDVSCSGDLCAVSAPGGALCDEQSFHVEVSDTSGLCPAQPSEQETYSKVTIINASDN